MEFYCIGYRVGYFLLFFWVNIEILYSGCYYFYGFIYENIILVRIGELNKYI